MFRLHLLPLGLTLTAVLTLESSLACLAALAQETSPSTQPPQGQMLPIEAEVQIGDRRFQLEVARTPRQQQIGLMFRPKLPADRGMVFPYDPPARPVAFWMYNTLVRLDIIFLYQGQVVHIAENVPGCPELPCPAYGPAADQLVDQVVELRGGTAAELGLSLGDEVQVQGLKS